MFISNNAYTILGLSTNTDEKALNKRYKELLHFLQIGEVPVYDTDISFINYKNKRTIEQVKEAFHHLSNQKKKMYQTFFWFQLTDTTDKDIFNTYKDHLEQYKTPLLTERILTFRNTNDFHCLKNHLIGCILLFEYQEQFGGKKYFLEDTALIAEEREILLSSEKFRNQFQEIFNQQNNIPIDHKHLQEFRNELPQYLANQIFDIAIKLNRSDLYSAFIDRFHISATTIEENEIIKHMIQYIEHTVSEIKETNTQKDIETIILKSNQIEAEVKKFDSLGLYNHAKIKNLKDDVANTIRNISVAITNKYSEYEHALTLLEIAMRIAYSKSLSINMEEDHKTLETLLFLSGKKTDKSLAKKKCPFCREEISENQKRCPFCGRILAEKVVIKKIEQQTEKSPIPKKEPIPEKSKKPKCPFCKAEIEKNTEFCPTCGRQIIENFSTPKTHKLSQQEILRKHITHIKSLLRTGQRNLAIQIMDTIMEDYILNDNEGNLLNELLTDQERSLLLDTDNPTDKKCSPSCKKTETSTSSYQAPQHSTSKVDDTEELSLKTKIILIVIGLVVLFVAISLFS